MSMIGFYFVQAILEQAGWPRKKGLFGGPQYDTFIVDQVIDQMLSWGASIAAECPKLSLQIIAEMFRNRDWDGNNAPEVKMLIDESREEWDKLSDGAPSDVVKPWRLASSIGKSMPAKQLMDKKLVAGIEQLLLESIMWGLGNPDRVKKWYNNHREKIKSSLPIMQEAGLQVEDLPPFDDWIKQCEKTLKDYERDVQPLSEIPKKLFQDAKSIRSDIE